MKRALLAAGVAAVVSLVPGLTQAQQGYPSKPVTVIVPVTPGSAQDYLARLLGPQLQQRLGQPFVVENKVGASGVIGAEALAKSAPDGHTLMLGGIVFAVAPSLRKTLPYDPIADFAPIAPVGVATMGFAVHPSVPVSTLSEFIAYARARPGKINYGSSGNGTPHHMFTELFKQQAKIDIVHVPYKQIGSVVSDVLAGQIECAFMTVFAIAPQVKAGKLKLLSVAGVKRSSSAPDTPTFREAGLEGLESEPWLGYMAPGKTPQEIIRRLNAELNRLIDMPENRAAISKAGIEPLTGSSADLGAFIKKDLELWRRVVEVGKIVAD